MSIIPDQWESWTDDDVWTTGPEPSPEDSRWVAETLNDDWHDLDGHPVIDDEREAEAEHWREQERRYPADPDPDDIAEADPWTDGDEWDADGRWDDMADDAAFVDAHERGLTFF